MNIRCAVEVWKLYFALSFLKERALKLKCNGEDRSTLPAMDSDISGHLFI